MLITLVTFVSSSSLYAQTQKSCPKGHVGFESIGVGTLGLTPDEKNPKKLNSVTLSINNGKQGFEKGLPLPCAFMLEARGVYSGSNKYESTDKFDLAIKECSKTVAKNGWDRFLKGAKRTLQKDPNKGKEFQAYSFNVEDKNSFLSPKYLKNLFAEGKVNQEIKAEFDKIISQVPGCFLRDIQEGKGYSLGDFIKCEKIGKDDVKKHLAKSEDLKNTCAISQGSNTFKDLHIYSTADKNTASIPSGEGAIRECINHFQGNDKVEKYFEYKFELNAPTVKKDNINLEFKSFDSNCDVVSASEVSKNMSVIEHISNVAKFYSDDISSCQDCLGAKVVNDKVELTNREIIDSLANPCLGGSGAYLDELKSNCPLNNEKESLSCTKINKCSLSLNLNTSVDALPIDNFENTVSKMHEGIYLKYALPFHMTTELVDKQNRKVSTETLNKLRDHFNQLKLCVKEEDRKYLKHLSMSTPSAPAKYIATNLKMISELVDGVGKYFNDSTTEEGFAQNASKLKSVFDEFGKKYSQLPKKENEIDAMKLQNEDCDALSSIIADKNKCKLTKDAMEKTSSDIEELKKNIGEKSTDNLEKLDNAISDVTFDSDVTAIKDYLVLVDNPGFGSINKTDNAVKFLALHDAIKSKVKDLEIEGCDFDGEPNLAMSEISKALGKGDKFLAGLTTKSDETGPSETASDEVNSDQTNELKATVAALQQQIAQLMANQANSGTADMMRMMMDQQIAMFKQYSTSVDQSLREFSMSNRYIVNEAFSKMQWSPQYTFSQPNYPASNFGNYMNSVNQSGQFNSFSQPVSGYNQSSSYLFPPK